MSDTGMDIEKVLARIKKDISNVVEHLALSNKQQADRIEQQEKEIAEWKGKYEWAVGKLKEAAEDEQ